MTTKVRRGRDAASLWFLEPLHTIHTLGLDGEAFLVSEGEVEVREGDEVVRLRRGEVAFGRAAGDPDRGGRIVPLAPLTAEPPEPAPWPGV